jgi:hypothetical protein
MAEDVYLPLLSIILGCLIAVVFCAGLVKLYINKRR